MLNKFFYLIFGLTLISFLKKARPLTLVLIYLIRGHLGVSTKNGVGGHGGQHSARGEVKSGPKINKIRDNRQIL